jgi:glycosyltransferase involved in cell wall biosynthesis
MPQVSVIIPTYGHRDYVLQTLGSVFSQTFSDYEIIVINDGSPDDTAQLLAPLAAAGRIRYFEQPNAGQSNARNRGLREARGEFIALLDDDDIWPADKLSWQVQFMQDNPGVGAVAGDRVWWDGVSQPPPARPETGPRLLTAESLFSGNPIASPGQVLLRRKLVEELGGFDPRIWGADDFDLWFRICRVSRYELYDRIALLYRAHASNASRHLDRMLANTRRVMEWHVRQADQSKLPGLRRTANRWMYKYAGERLVERLRGEIARGEVNAALRSLRTLAAFGPLGATDPVLIRRIASDLLPIRQIAQEHLPTAVLRLLQVLKWQLAPSPARRAEGNGEALRHSPEPVRAPADAPKQLRSP